MRFVRFELLRFYRTAYAHTLHSGDYRYILDSHGFGIYGGNSPNGGVFEIGTVEKNPLVLRDRDTREEHLVHEKEIFIIPPNHRFDVRTLYPGEHQHTSAEFLIDSRVERTPLIDASGERISLIK